MVVKPCALQNCFLIRRHLPDGHSQSETHSDLLPEYLVVRMVGAITLINMIMRLLPIMRLLLLSNLEIPTAAALQVTETPWERVT